MEKLTDRPQAIKAEISIRLCLFTQWGGAGHRLRRSEPLPVASFDFPDTPLGREQAEEARKQLQRYCDENHGRGDKR